MNVRRSGARVFVLAVAMAVAGAMAALPAYASPSGSALAPPDSGHHSGQVHRPAESEHAGPNPLLKEIFAEGEEEEDGDDPGLSALCQSFLGKPSPYRRLAPNVDAIVGDATVPTGTQEGCSTAQNETTIAVNPANPRNIVAGSNDYRIFNTREARNDASGWAYTSFDGGRTWRDVLLPRLNFQTGADAPLSYMDSAGDPAIAFGPNNTVYYATLVFSRAVPPEGQQLASGIAVSVSHNGGLNWGAPAILELDGVTAAGTPTPTYVFNDKEWIAADPKSGKVYVTWTVFTYDQEGNYVESPIVASASTNFGRTWSGPRRVSPPTTNSTSGITSSAAAPTRRSPGTAPCTSPTRLPCARVSPAINPPTTTRSWSRPPGTADGPSAASRWPPTTTSRSTRTPARRD
jgi:hypothetical protein